MLYDESDLAVQQEFVDWMNPSGELLLKAAQAFESAPNGELEVDELRELIVGRNRGDRRAEYCAITLEKLGVIEASELERYRFVRPIRAEEIDTDDIEAKRKRDLERLLDAVRLVRSEDIRGFVIDYFGLDDNLPRPNAPGTGGEPESV